MMALAMVVIASMIGVQGLGLPVLRAISAALGWKPFQSYYY